MDDRSLSDCHVTEEAPGGYGFGEAGLQLTAQIRMAPSMYAGNEINLPITFKLPTGIFAKADQADQCAAEGVALSKVRTLSPTAQWWARYWVALSKKYAANAGNDAADRLDPSITAAGVRLAAGSDNGLFGIVRKCFLN